MKKLCFTAASLLLMLAACNNTKTETAGGDQSMAQKHLDAMHVVNHAFETGDVSGIDSVVAADFVDHTDKGEMGRDSLKAMIRMVHATNKDMKSDIMKEVADDDYAFSMQHFSGTSDGSMMPAGPYDMHVVEVVRFKDGKAVEHWEYMRPDEMMKMMSQMPPMDKKMPAAKVDSAHH